MKKDNQIQNRNKKPTAKPAESKPTKSKQAASDLIISELTDRNQKLRAEIADLKAQLADMQQAKAKAETNKKATARVTFRRGIQTIEQE
ncbi:hypothetical protein [Ralstonia sp.]|uniref:hypothetical protein n=1 Tax=Ralstonia sp. TaxID=54061 RepID=UPI002C53A1D5|nr:hypothetical protein [Ralstonia sp.]HWV02972.1 hypothetical protein [Ralstonia sp.]